jgi:multiple sugar transport system permease protein
VATTVERTQVPPQRRQAAARRRLADREGALAWIFLMPSVVYILALVAVPFVLAVGFAMSDVTTGDPSFDWVGFRNFQAIFDDPVFWQSLRNTILFSVGSMLLIVVFGRVLAMILVADFKGRWLLRFLVLLPWTTPVALSAIAWLWLLDSVFSPIDWVLRQVGLTQGNLYWLGEPNLALLSVIAVHSWRLIPLAAVIIMAGLVALPRDLTEAAEIDGATWWRKQREIILPLTLPITAVAALFGAILTFTDMAVVYVLTRGGPNNASQVLTSWAFFKGVQGGDIAQGAAMALFLFPLLLASAIAILQAVRRSEVL